MRPYGGYATYFKYYKYYNMTLRKDQLSQDRAKETNDLLGQPRLMNEYRGMVDVLIGLWRGREVGAFRVKIHKDSRNCYFELPIVYFSTEWFEVLSDKDPCHAGRVWNNALPDNENPGWFSPTYTVQTVERLRVISALIVCANFFLKFELLNLS